MPEAKSRAAKAPCRPQARVISAPGLCGARRAAVAAVATRGKPLAPLRAERYTGNRLCCKRSLRRVRTCPLTTRCGGRQDHRCALSSLGGWSGAVWRKLTAGSPALRPSWLANDQRSGLRSVHLLWLARRRRTYAWGWVGLGFPKQVHTTDSSNDCHLCRGRNQHPLREFPHHLLLIRGSSGPSAGERLEIREIWRSADALSVCA
jgi:hypothetical protein